MALRRYKMAATISATGNNQDTLTAQRAGTIKQVIFHALFDSVTDNAAIRTQLAKSAVSDIGTGAGTLSNCIAQFFQQSNFVTSGLGQPPGNFAVDCNDRISVGEQLFINSVVTGTVSVAVEIVVVIEENG